MIAGKSRSEMVSRIEICGGIAAGKTTLANALSEEGFSACFETFESNPFWRAFYRDSRRHAFETEITFLLQHYHQIRDLDAGSNVLCVCDFSLILDRAYAGTTLTDEELPAFLAVYEVVCRRLALPKVVVHLRCSANGELDRVVQRGREVERTTTLDLLVRLNAAIEEQLAARNLNVPILRIDSDRLDFREGGAHKDQVVAQVKEAVQRSIPSPP
jgi:deoxyguanosine kinase